MPVNRATAHARRVFYWLAPLCRNLLATVEHVVNGRLLNADHVRQSLLASKDGFGPFKGVYANSLAHGAKYRHAYSSVNRHSYSAAK